MLLFIELYFVLQIVIRSYIESALICYQAGSKTLDFGQLAVIGPFKVTWIKEYDMGTIDPIFSKICENLNTGTFE